MRLGPGRDDVERGPDVDRGKASESFPAVGFWVAGRARRGCGREPRGGGLGRSETKEGGSFDVSGRSTGLDGAHRQEAMRLLDDPGHALAQGGGEKLVELPR